MGVLLAGYGPGTKDVSRQNTVANNHLHHVGALLWHAPAIFAWQSGENTITRNLIHNVPYAGIVVSGRIVWDRTGQGECSRTIRWHEVDRALPPAPGHPTWREREPFLHARKNLVGQNEIHHAMERLGDGNPIYVSGCGTGNRVTRNFLHDNLAIDMNGVIRCDDDQHGTVIEGNILYRNRCAAGVISKGVNHIINNIMVDLRPAHKGRAHLFFPIGPIAGSVVCRNVFCPTDPALIPVKALRLYGDGPVPQLADLQANENLYFAPATRSGPRVTWPRRARRAWRRGAWPPTRC